VSQPEVQQAIQNREPSTSPYKTNKTVTWITDRGFDDVAVCERCGTGRHVVCRVYHFERTVALRVHQGTGSGNLAGPPFSG